MSLLLASRPLACTCNFPALLCFIPPPSVTHCLLDPVLLTSPCTCRVLPPVDLVSLLSSAFLIPGLRSVGHRPLLALSAGSLGLIHSAGVVITVRVSYLCMFVPHEVWTSAAVREAGEMLGRLPAAHTATCWLGSFLCLLFTKCRCFHNGSWPPSY